MPKARKAEAKDKTETSPKSPRTVSFKVPETRILAIVGGLMLVSFLVGVLGTNLAYKLNNAGTDTLAGAGAGAGAPAAPTGPIEAVEIDNGHLPQLGRDDAKVTVIEFSDFQCPFCKQLFESALPSIKSDYIDSGKAKFFYRQLPLTAIHPNAMKASVASECANDQGKFWEMHDQLFKDQLAWSNLGAEGASDKFKEYAGTLGLNAGEFNSCLDADEHSDEINQDMTDAGAAGVSGTPGTLVNGKLISGACDGTVFGSAIQAELDGKEWSAHNCAFVAY